MCLQMGLMISGLHLLVVRRECPLLFFLAPHRCSEAPSFALAFSFMPEFPKLIDWHNEFYTTCSLFLSLLTGSSRMEGFI